MYDIRSYYAAPEFYPPYNLSPAEIGYAVDGIVDSKDVISLLIYWADKGYIRIEERKNNDFYLIKLQSLPDDAQYYEHIMFRITSYNVCYTKLLRSRRCRTDTRS